MFRSPTKRDNYPISGLFLTEKHDHFFIVHFWKTFSLLCSAQTQREGLIFIYDMTNSGYGNFDYELCVKILNLLKVNTKIFFHSIGFGFLIELFFIAICFCLGSFSSSSKVRLHSFVTALVSSTFRCLAAICAREVKRTGTQKLFT